MTNESALLQARDNATDELLRLERVICYAKRRTSAGESRAGRSSAGVRIGPAGSDGNDARKLDENCTATFGGALRAPQQRAP